MAYHLCINDDSDATSIHVDAVHKVFKDTYKSAKAFFGEGPGNLLTCFICNVYIERNKSAPSLALTDFHLGADCS